MELFSFRSVHPFSVRRRTVGVSNNTVVVHYRPSIDHTSQDPTYFVFGVHDLVFFFSSSKHLLQLFYLDGVLPVFFFCSILIFSTVFIFCWNYVMQSKNVYLHNTIYWRMISWAYLKFQLYTTTKKVMSFSQRWFACPCLWLYRRILCCIKQISNVKISLFYNTCL